MGAHSASADSLVPFKRGEGATTAERSQLMGRVRQAKTVPEEVVAAWLREHGVRYRRNVPRLPGRPDFANQRAGFAIFVHGCFWHRHSGCPRATTPTRNRAFWLDKFAANVARDAARSSQLEQAGLQTVIVWECETEDAAVLEARLAPLLGATDGGESPSGSRPTVRPARGTRAVGRVWTRGEGS